MIDHWRNNAELNTLSAYWGQSNLKLAMCMTEMHHMQAQYVIPGIISLYDFIFHFGKHKSIE
jgi:hypothetical protein